MPVRTADAEWKGGIMDGGGRMALGSGAFEGQYSFGTRFENGTGTNPEELIGAAHAGCFSMALTAALGRAGYSPQRVATSARVHFEKVDGAPTITRIELTTEAEVADITDEAFQEQATGAKENCPVSKALAGVQIELTAKLV